jgi:hypothetical protein
LTEPVLLYEIPFDFVLFEIGPSRWIGGECTWWVQSTHREDDIVTAILVAANTNTPRNHIL